MCRFRNELTGLETQTRALLTSRKEQFELLVQHLRNEFRKADSALNKLRNERKTLHSQQYAAIGEFYLQCKEKLAHEAQENALAERRLVRLLEDTYARLELTLDFPSI